MNKTQIALAVAGAFGAVSVQAATVNLTLVSETGESANGSSFNNLTGSNATWSYDTVSDILTGSGLFKSHSQINPFATSQLFDRNVVDMVVGGGSAASATSYSCVEGTFGGTVGATLCGNYNWGANFVEESSVSYGPGTAFTQTIGGDDGLIGPAQSIAQYDGMVGSWDGTTLVMDNAVTAVGGYTMAFTLAPNIPVPAAVWLFGSALGLLGWARRRATT